MKHIFTSLMLVTTLSFAHAQQVSTFAGKVNSDPNSNFNNATASASDAYFYDPEGLAFDPNGNLYITERNKVRLMIGNQVYNRSGFVGNPSFSQGFADGAATAGRYFRPTGAVCASNGDAYIVDSENHAIRKINAFTALGTQQNVTTFAGAKTTNPVGGMGTSGDADGMGNNARFHTPKGIAMDATGTMYVTDWWNSTVRKISPTGSVTTVAGKSGTQGSKDGQGTNAEFSGPYGVVVLDNQNILVTDQVNCNIRKINTVNGTVTTLCGKAGTSRHKDGSLSEALFMQPKGITILDGLIYVCDFTTIRVIDLNAGTVSTLAGSSTQQGNVDGNGAEARFGNLAGMTAKDDALYVTDVEYHIIKKVVIENLVPRANFTASSQNLLINEETTLTDASGGQKPFTYEWTIEKSEGAGGYTLVSGDESSESLTVSFPTTGFYNVELKISNSYGENTLRREGFFSVSTTGNVENQQSEWIKLYPVPVNESLQIDINKTTSKGVDVEIYDMQGRLVNSRKFMSTENLSMKTSDLESGQYFVVLRSEDFRGFRKFSKL
jgi:hypothetical protein